MTPPPSATVRRLAAALVAGGLLSLTACGGSDDNDAKPTPAQTASSPAPTSSAPVDSRTRTKQEVSAAYTRFWQETVKAYAKNDVKGTELKTYAAGPALIQTENDLTQRREAGIVSKGSVSNSITFKKVLPDKKVPFASFEDCTDTTKWKRLHAKSGKAVEMPKGHLPRFITEIEAERWEGQWKVITLKPQQRAC